MVDQGAKLFDELVVAIGENPDKTYSFSLKERLEMLQETVGGIANVRITSFENQFLVRYARQLSASFILRGIRNPNDYEYERGMRQINSDMAPDVTTLFLMPPRAIAEVSSGFVKGLVGPEGWEELIRPYVPEPVYRRLIRRGVPAGKPSQAST